MKDDYSAAIIEKPVAAAAVVMPANRMNKNKEKLKIIESLKKTVNNFFKDCRRVRYHKTQYRLVR